MGSFYLRHLARRGRSLRYKFASPPESTCVHCGHQQHDHCGCGQHCLYVTPEEQARAMATDGVMEVACKSCPGFEGAAA